MGLPNVRLDMSPVLRFDRGLARVGDCASSMRWDTEAGVNTVFIQVHDAQAPTEATRTLLQRARDAGCVLSVAADGALVVRAPKGVLTEARLAKLERAAGALVELLRVAVIGEGGSDGR